MADNNYVLLNKDVPVLNFTFAENPDIHTPLIKNINEVYNLHYAPFSIVARCRDKTELSDLNNWWIQRGISFYYRSRYIGTLRENLNYEQYYAVLRQNMGRGLTDHYWIKQENDSRRYDEVNFFDNAFSEDLGNLFLTKDNYILKEEQMLTPDLTLTGHSFKTWKIGEGGERLLYRIHHRNREIYNEFAAMAILDIFEIKHADYSEASLGDNLFSVSKNFITKDTENICLKTFDSGINYFENGYLCEFLGKEKYAEFLQDVYKNFLIGYVVNNWEMEIGYLRNANTMEVRGVAPVCDFSGAFWIGYDYEEWMQEKVEPVFVKALPLYVEQAGLNINLFDEIVPAAMKIYAGCPYFESGELDYVIRNMQARVENIRKAATKVVDAYTRENWAFEKMYAFVEKNWYEWLAGKKG